MTEANTPRLMAAAKEFNVGKDTLIDVLVSKGFSGDDLKPTSKITEDMYRVLQLEFQQDKVAKQKAEQIDLPKNATADLKKKRDEEDISIKKKEAAKVKEMPVTQAPVEDLKVEPVIEPVKEIVPEPVIESITPLPEITKIEAPEIEQPKIIDKIDLSTIDSSTRPKKDDKKKDIKPDESKKESSKKPKVDEEPIPIEEPKPVEIITEPEAPKNDPAIIENIKADKLEGPRIMGKIDLPANNDTRPRPNDEKRKRKRIPVDQKKVGNSPQSNFQRAPHTNNTQGGPVISRPYQGNRPQGAGTAGGGRFNRNAPAVARRDDKEIDQKEIQDKIRETQAKLAGSGGRGKSLKAKYRKAKRDEAAENMSGDEAADNKLQVTEFISVSEFANLMDVSFAEVISKCMSLGIMVSINQRLEADVIELVAGEFGHEVEFIGI